MFWQNVFRGALSLPGCSEAHCQDAGEAHVSSRAVCRWDLEKEQVELLENTALSWEEFWDEERISWSSSCTALGKLEVEKSCGEMQGEEQLLESKAWAWERAARLTLCCTDWAMLRKQCLGRQQSWIGAGFFLGLESEPMCALSCSWMLFSLLRSQLETSICYATKFPRQLFVGKVIWLSYLKIDALKAFLNLLIKYDALLHYQRKCWQAGFSPEHLFSSNHGPNPDSGVTGTAEGPVWPLFKTRIPNLSTPTSFANSCSAWHDPWLQFLLWQSCLSGRPTDPTERRRVAIGKRWGETDLRMRRIRALARLQPHLGWKILTRPSNPIAYPSPP